MCVIAALCGVIKMLSHLHAARKQEKICKKKTSKFFFFFWHTVHGVGRIFLHIRFDVCDKIRFLQINMRKYTNT